MAKIKYRSGSSFVELFDTATISNIQTRLSTVEGSLNRRWANSWLCEKRDDGFCTAVQHRAIVHDGPFLRGPLRPCVPVRPIRQGLFRSRRHSRRKRHGMVRIGIEQLGHDVRSANREAHKLFER